MTQQQVTPNGVVLPVALYTVMAHCYYGNGPRFREASDPLPSKADGPVSVNEQLPQSKPIDEAELVIVPNRSVWKGRGMAGRILPETPPPEGPKS